MINLWDWVQFVFALVGAIIGLLVVFGDSDNGG